MSTVRPARRTRWVVVGFVLLNVLPSAAILLALAVVARKATVGEWAGLGIGGSVGALVGIVVLFGWRLVGPVPVSRAAEQERRALYAESLADRAPLLLAGLVVGALVSALLAPESRGTAATMAVAMCLTGLTATWFFVGTGDPWTCLVAEMAPRMVLTVAGGVAVLLGAPVLFFPLALTAGFLAGALVVTRLVLPEGAGRLVRAALPLSMSRLRAQSTAAASEILAGGYTVASVAVVGAVATPGVTGAFSAGDRVFRAALIPVSALASTLQPRVARETGAAFRRQARSALGQHLALGLAGLAGLALLGGPTSRLLFGDVGELPESACVAYGVAFLSVALNSSLARHVLVPLGRTRAVMFGSLAGSLVGVAGMLAGASHSGISGAVWGLAVGEVAVVVVLGLAAAKRP